jgi:hypothetical protein
MLAGWSELSAPVTLSVFSSLSLRKNEKLDNSLSLFSMCQGLPLSSKTGFSLKTAKIIKGDEEK